MVNFVRESLIVMTCSLARMPIVKGGAICRYYRISWYWEPTIIVSWWFYDYHHIIFTFLVVLLR